MLAHGSLDFLGFPHTNVQSQAHKHTHLFRNALIDTHAHTNSRIRTFEPSCNMPRHWSLMTKSIHNIKAVIQEASVMSDPGSVSVFFSKPSIYDLNCMFKETWIIRLRKSCEKETRRKKATLLGISLIVPTHTTFLAVDSQPWERTLVNQPRHDVSWDWGHCWFSLRTRAPICISTPAFVFNSLCHLQKMPRVISCLSHYAMQAKLPNPCFPLLTHYTSYLNLIFLL